MPGGHELLAALRGDLHSHSDWSDGGSPISAMVDAAKILGREYLALTDHSPNLKIANGLSAGRLAEQLDVVSDINADGGGFRLGHRGRHPRGRHPGPGPGDAGPAGYRGRQRAFEASLRQTHHDTPDARRHRGPAHQRGRPLHRPPGSRRPGNPPASEFDAEEVFDACAEHNVAVEINSRPERQDPPGAFQLAFDAGCLFSINSDAHAPGQLDFLQYGAERAERNGVPAERIVSTWPLERLLEWAAAGR